jgi:spore maturation protein SpmA
VLPVIAVAQAGYAFAPSTVWMIRQQTPNAGIDGVALGALATARLFAAAAIAAMTLGRRHRARRPLLSADAEGR